MALVEIGITGNGGYGPDQVRKMTVGELISELENYESDDEVYLYDGGNRYGAAYGYINYVSYGKDEDEDDEDFYESNLYSRIKKNSTLDEYEEVKERKIPLGLNDDKSRDIINAVVGQLSDGMWENSPGMERYWKFAHGLDKDGNIVVDNGYKSEEYYGGMNRYGYTPRKLRWVYSAFSKMSDDQVKKYFANKIKQIVKEEGLEWNRNNTDPCEYLDYHSGVTVRDAYKVYDKLLGRIDRITDDVEPSEDEENI